MQKSITESEERLERKIVQYTERKIAEVNQRLDAFELRVLARTAPPVDVLTLQAAVESLRADIDTILEASVGGPICHFRDSTTSPSRAGQEA